MAQAGLLDTKSLPGITTDQPEVFESEPALSDDTGVNDLDLNTEPHDDNIALIDVPVKQAFSYFAEREHEIAKFYVQRYGEYKIAGDKPDDETDVEKVHRLRVEINQLLEKFQSNQTAKREKVGLSMPTIALKSNLEVLSRQLKELEVAAEGGTLDPTQSGFTSLKMKLDEFKEKVASGQEEEPEAIHSERNASLFRMSALERRLNMLESFLGNNDAKLQNLLKTTKSENLTEATETLGSWMSLFRPETLQRVNTEIDFLTQQLERLSERATNAEEMRQLDPHAKSKLDHLYNLVTSTDKHRALVPTIIHRLNAMEELQQKAAQVTTTVNLLEQTQARIVDNLRSNKDELSSLNEMFSKNIDLIKGFSADIDSRITAIRERDQ